MAEQDKDQNQENQNLQTLNLKLDIPDLVLESYAKAFMAYRVSLENWFLLNELVAYTKGEKLDANDIQDRLKRLFTAVNSDIIKELVNLNQVAERKAKLAEEKEANSKEKKEDDNKEEK